MKICYISEKPSVSRLIEEHYRKRLLNPTINSEPSLKIQHITDGNDTIILIPLAGHILNLYQMHDYPYGKDLSWRDVVRSKKPFIPTEFEVQPRPNNEFEKTPNFTTKLLERVSELTADVDEIVNVGDPDEEGQFLVDEIFDYLRSPAGAKFGFHTNAKFTRMFIRSTDDIGVDRAINKRIPNESVRVQGLAAKGRSIADWLWGANLTMLTTELLGSNFIENRNNKKIRPILSVGRVQTPVLNLIATREEEIKNFVPQTFFNIVADMNKDGSDKFQGELNLTKPELLADLENGNSVDANNRLISKAKADELKSKFTVGQQCAVKEAKTTESNEFAPLPLSIEELQGIMSKRYKMSASTTLEVAQQLYMAKFITYPRNNGVRHLPTEMQNDVPSTLAAIFSINEDLFDKAKPLVNENDMSSKVWNDEKAGSHYAIIPTSAISLTSYAQFSTQQRQLYQEVVKYYLYIFMPKAVKRAVKAKVEHKEDAKLELNVSESTYIELGYREAFGEYKNESKELPKLNTGDLVTIQGINIREGSTRPPEYFTSGTLIKAMEQAYRYVHDDSLRERLKGNVDLEDENAQEFQLSVGIGSSSTRGEILKTLQQRKFVTVDKDDKFYTTDRGRFILNKLPDFIKLPDNTARWQLELDQVRKGEEALDWFIKKQTEELLSFFAPTVEELGKDSPLFKYERKVLSVERDVKDCPRCGGKMRREETENSEGVRQVELICENEHCHFKEQEVNGVYYTKFVNYPTNRACPNCGKSKLKFSSGFSLKNNKPYSFLNCEKCGKIFSSNEKMEIEVKKTGTPTNYECEICHSKLLEQKGVSKTTGKPYHLFVCSSAECDSKYWADTNGKPFYTVYSQDPCPNCGSKMQLSKGVKKTGEPVSFYRCVNKEKCGFIANADSQNRMILNISEFTCLECQSKMELVERPYVDKQSGENKVFRYYSCVNPKCKKQYSIDPKTKKPINPYDFRTVEGTQRQTRLIKGSHCPKCKGEVSENVFASNTGKKDYYNCNKCRIFLDRDGDKFKLQ